MPSAELSTILDTSRVLVTMGPGGVGKTTLAATLALEAARRGRRVALCTIDPARRLADALGLEDRRSMHEPSPLSPELTSAAGITTGTLHAMMLDEKAAFDALATRHVHDPRQREAMLSHPWYSSVTDRLAGIREYLALDVLSALSEDPRFDTIILDTPPTHNALDFLRAPQRLLSYFKGDVASRLLTPLATEGGRAARLVGVMGGGLVVRVLQRFTGAETLQAIASFLLLLRGVLEALAERVDSVQSVLAADDTAILLVTSPWQTTMTEARAFQQALARQELNASALLVNRVAADPYRDTDGADDSAHILAMIESLDLPVSDKQALVGCAHRSHQIALLHQDAIDNLTRSSKGTPLVIIPKLPLALHDVPELLQLGRAIFGPTGTVA